MRRTPRCGVHISTIRSLAASSTPTVETSPTSSRKRCDGAPAWDAGFVDALCEPPESFTYGSVVAHVIEYGAIRRAMLASVLAQLGAGDAEATDGDPISWERGSA